MTSGRFLAPRKAPIHSSVRVPQRARATPALASRCSTQRPPEAEAAGQGDPVADPVAQHSSDHPSPGPVDPHGLAEQETPRARRVGLDPREVARLPRPVELVGLAAVEEVELFRPFLEGALYGQPQGHEADAARRMAGVPARLIEVERPATAEAVQGRGRLPVDAENEEAEPSEREGQPAELVVKGDDAR